MEQFYIRTNFSDASFMGADLRRVDCNHAKFNGALLDNNTQLGDITWGGSNLSVIDWSKIPRLGDELNKENRPEQIARANRQLAAELRGQGIDAATDSPIAPESGNAEPRATRASEASLPILVRSFSMYWLDTATAQPELSLLICWSSSGSLWPS